MAMRRLLKGLGWTLVAGEYPGGSDHELYPLNVVSPEFARDESPDPSRHSLGEIIPDLVALRARTLLLAEAKVRYSEADREKLGDLLSTRRRDLLSALEKFARERGVPALLPVETLAMAPVLVFASTSVAPQPQGAFSHLRITAPGEGRFEGLLARTSP